MIGASQLQAALELETNPTVLQARVVAEGIAATLVPFCEVAVYDLLDPGNAIIAFYNNLSGPAYRGPNNGSRILPRRRPKSPADRSQLREPIRRRSKAQEHFNRDKGFHRYLHRFGLPERRPLVFRRILGRRSHSSRR
jgi:hypothetical protein